MRWELFSVVVWLVSPAGGGGGGLLSPLISLRSAGEVLRLLWASVCVLERPWFGSLCGVRMGGSDSVSLTLLAYHWCARSSFFLYTRALSFAALIRFL